jgi:hypothetical protein
VFAVSNGTGGNIMSCTVVLGHPTASSIRVVITGTVSAKLKQDLLQDIRDLAKSHGLKYKQIQAKKAKKS